MLKNKLYTIITVACLSGFIYLFYTLFYSESAHFGFCFIKNVTGISCPSCGTTRAIHLILKGKIIDSLLMNPFGIIVAFGMIIVPLWIAFDVISKKETFFIYYKKAEETLRIRGIAITLIILVILNWIWIIYKGL